MPSAVDRVRFSRFVGRALASARERGMTDPQIEAATGVRASTFHRWRRGEVAPSVDKVRLFCAGLGLSAAEALAALGMGPREATPEPPMHPVIRDILHKLSDPNVSADDKEYLMRALAAASAQVRPQRRPRKAS